MSDTKALSPERADADAPIRYVRGEISARAFIAAERRNTPDYGAALLSLGERHKAVSDEKHKASA